MVLTTISGLLVSLSGLTMGLVPLAVYLSVVFLAAVFNQKLGLFDRLALLLVLPAMHFSWGIGFIAGLFHKR